MPPTANIALIDGLVCPSTTIATWRTVPTIEAIVIARELIIVGPIEGSPNMLNDHSSSNAFDSFRTSGGGDEIGRYLLCATLRLLVKSNSLNATRRLHMPDAIKKEIELN